MPLSFSFSRTPLDWLINWLYFLEISVRACFASLKTRQSRVWRVEQDVWYRYKIVFWRDLKGSLNDSRCSLVALLTIVHSTFSNDVVTSCKFTGNLAVSFPQYWNLESGRELSRTDSWSARIGSWLMTLICLSNDMRWKCVAK